MMYGVYRVSQRQLDSGKLDGHTGARSALVKRGGKHVQFKTERAAQEWVDHNSNGEQMFVRKVSKEVK